MLSKAQTESSGHHVLSWEYTAKTKMWVSEGHVKLFGGLTISSRFSIPRHNTEAILSVGYLEQCQGTSPTAAPHQSWNRTVMTRLVQGRTPELEGSSHLSHLALPPPCLPQSSPHQSPSLALRKPRGALFSGDCGSRGVTHPPTLTVCPQDFILKSMSSPWGG